jgi:hypothetical protein
MRSFLVRLSVGLAALVASAAVVGCAADSNQGANAPVLADANATGRELATRFLTIVQSKDSTALANFLDDSFQLQRADGSAANKSDYLKNPAKISSFKVGPDVVGVQVGNVLTVRWGLEVDETINGKVVDMGEAPRLSTFVWRDGEWKLASHANFVLPAATEAPVLADPAETGRELALRFITILKDKDENALAAFLANGFQIQRADGSGATRVEYLDADINISSFTIGDEVKAVQDGNTLTVRWALQLDETLNGKVTGKKLAPRLSTFIWEDGGWKLLSHANFNPPVS